MTLNHSKSIKTAVYIPTVCFLFLYGMHSRDATVLFDLMLFTTPACFSTVF